MQAANRSPLAVKQSAAGDSTPPPSEMRSRSDEAEFLLTGKEDLLRTASLTGHVRIEQTGPQPMQGDAGRLILDFAGQNQLQNVHAVDGVRLTQNAAPGSQPATKNIAAGPQDFELTAPAIDFTVANGHILQHAVTSGAAQITIVQSQSRPPISARPSPPPRTVVTAGQFQAQFAASQGRNHHTSVHAPSHPRLPH